MTKLLWISKESIQEAAKLIREGGLVAYPTDTVYGLGCDPFNPQAVERLVRAKERKIGALPLLIDSLDMGKKIAIFNEQALSLARRFWPGPLTIVVPSNVHLPESVTGATETVGLRMPNRTDTLQLIEQSGGVLVGTSANLAGQRSSRSASEVMLQLGERLDIILDGGVLSLSTESTVVKPTDSGLIVVREGAIAKGTIDRALDSRPQSLVVVCSDA